MRMTITASCHVRPIECQFTHNTLTRMTRTGKLFLRLPLHYSLIYRAFRSLNLDFSLQFEVDRPSSRVSSPVSLDSQPTQDEVQPQVLLYANTLKWLSTLQV